MGTMVHLPPDELHRDLAHPFQIRPPHPAEFLEFCSWKPLGYMAH